MLLPFFLHWIMTSVFVAYLFNCCLLSYFPCQLYCSASHDVILISFQFNGQSKKVMFSANTHGVFRRLFAFKPIRKHTKYNAFQRQAVRHMKICSCCTRAYRTNKIFMSNWNRLYFILLLYNMQEHNIISFQSNLK